MIVLLICVTAATAFVLGAGWRRSGGKEADAADAGRRRLQTGRKLKAAVLDALAHDVKTPLTTIKVSISALLSETAGHSKRMELVHAIHDQVENLDRIIAESIEIARIEFLGLKLEKRRYEVRETIEAVLSGFERSSGGRLIVRIPEGLLPVKIDFRLIKIVLRQLIDNALKYSKDQLPVIVSASQRGRYVILCVRDFGLGISPREQRFIFRKYYRAREAFERAPGTGVGLAIAKHIVTAHGGKITLASRPGEGCRFRVLLPHVREEER